MYSLAFYSLDSLAVILLLTFTGFLVFKENRNRLLDLSLSVLLAVAFSEAIKYYVNKPRPDAEFNFEGGSFPSTHTAIAFSVVFFYLLVCHKSSRHKQGVGELMHGTFTFKDAIIPAIVFFIGLIVAYLRIILGAHYIIDVVAGIILGLLSAIPFVFYDISGRRVA